MGRGHSSMQAEEYTRQTSERHTVKISCQFSPESEMYVHWWVLKGEVRPKMRRWFIMRAMEPPCSSSTRLHSVSSAFFTPALPPTNFLGICSTSRMLYMNTNVLILLVWPNPSEMSYLPCMFMAYEHMTCPLKR